MRKMKIFIPAYKVVYYKNRKCKECGGTFTRDQPKEHMLDYALIKYCNCGNRIVIGFNGIIYED